MENETKVARPKSRKKNIIMAAVIAGLVVVIGGLSTTLVVMGNTRGGKGCRSQRTEMTYEQRAERQQQAQARVAQRFADGEITQEAYEEMMAAIEAGERIASGRNRRSRSLHRGERSGYAAEEATIGE